MPTKLQTTQLVSSESRICEKGAKKGGARGGWGDFVVFYD